MGLRNIRLYPDPVLRVECQDVEAFDEDLEELVHDMVATMYDAPGIGLAAPQVGVTRRVAVVDVGSDTDEQSLLVLVNPEIVQTSDITSVESEGCLSIPEFSEKVKRPEEVRVHASDVTGEEFEIEASGLCARAIQHELDHLDGVLFVDHLKGLRRERARRHLKRLQSYARTSDESGAS